MRKRNEYTILNQTFKTKKALAEKIRSILHSYEISQSLNETDFAFMKGVLELHPSAEQKKGCGVKSIRVEIDGWGKNVCFKLTRNDGSETDFSYLHCLNKEETPLVWFKKSARTAVESQILQFRDNAFKKNANKDGCILCPIKGILVTNANAHVDHAPPCEFDTLVNSFLNETGINPAELEYNGFGDNEYKKSFADKEIEKRWAEYHKKHAILRITSIAGNLEN